MRTQRSSPSSPAGRVTLEVGDGSGVTMANVTAVPRWHSLDAERFSGASAGLTCYGESAMEHPRATSALTAIDYLTMERAALSKHECWNGELVAVAGSNFDHNVIVGTMVRVLGNIAGPCVVLPSNMKIHVPARGGFVYPDLSIVCGAPEFFDDVTDVLVNPTAIVEVLSDATERFDRGEKFAGYRTLPSLREYLLVAQDEARVEHFERVAGDIDSWLLRCYGAGQRLRLAATAGELAVDDIYANVGWARG